MTARKGKTLVQRLWRHVHPDLFQRHPHAQAINQRSMQELNAFLDTAASLQSTSRQQQPATAETIDLRFYVQTEDTQDALREVSLQWRPPTAAMRFADRPAERWTRSADKCVAALLSQIEQTAVDTDVDTDDKQEATAKQTRRGGTGPMISDTLKPDQARYNAMVRAAAESASRRRSGSDTSGASADASVGTDAFEAGMRKAAAAAAASSGRGLNLSDDLLFFYGLTDSEKVDAADDAYLP